MFNLIFYILSVAAILSFVCGEWLEAITEGMAVLLNLPLPLLHEQILFLYLVMDVFPALALGFGKGEQGVMDSLPYA